MISELELTGGAEEPEPEVISDADREPRPEGGGRWYRDRRRWAWGVGGLAVASVAWAGGLQAYHSHHRGGPDLHGYVLGASPCAGSTLKPLTEALSATQSATVSPAAARLGPALDQIRCTLSVSAPIQHVGTARYEAFVTIDLHKKTDPRPEFDDQRGIDTTDLTPVQGSERVSGLGDEAVLETITDQAEELRVLHGGAVFTLTLTGYNTLDISDDTLNALHGSTLSTPDIDDYRSALVAAMRNVMSATRR